MQLHDSLITLLADTSGLQQKDKTGQTYIDKNINGTFRDEKTGGDKMAASSHNKLNLL